MRITETKVRSLRDVHLEFEREMYPVPNDIMLPFPYFVSNFVGVRGSGKTFACVQLLKHYERSGFTDVETGCRNVPQRIILFTPTFSANPVWTALKYLDAATDLHEEYSDAKLVAVINEIQKEAMRTREYKHRMRLWARFVKCNDPSREFDANELFELEEMGFSPPTAPQFPNGQVYFLILDDLVGTSAFKSVGKSALTNLALRNRHLACNVFILGQNLKGIPKSIRLNTSLYVIFRFASRKIMLDDLYPEVSNVLTEEEFEQLYEAAVQGGSHTDGRVGHDFLVIDTTTSVAAPERMFRRNWDNLMRIGPC